MLLPQRDGIFLHTGFRGGGAIRDNLNRFGQIPDEQVREMAALFQIGRDMCSLSENR